MTPPFSAQALPSSAVLREVGPRDGFQNETKYIPPEVKASIIRSLSLAGFTHIQAVSFVHPEKVPQMRDAEQVMALLEKQPGVTYSGLALNMAGMRRAVASGVDAVEVSVSASDAHSRKNTGMGADQALGQALEMAALGKSAGLKIFCSIQCAFGCAFEGDIAQDRVLSMAEKMLAQAPDFLCIADTTGMAGPLQAASLTAQAQSLAGDSPVFLHLHDTRGLGLANMLAALLSGIRHFDASLGGMGGCPFIPQAAGNIATEQAVHLMDRLGVKTGVDLARVASCSRDMEQILRRVLPGRLHHLDGA